MLQKTCHRVGFLEVDTAMDMERFFLLGMNRKQVWSEEKFVLLFKSKELSANPRGSSRVSIGPQSILYQAEMVSPLD